MSQGRVEIITGKMGRRRWSTADKLRIVAETHQPGVRVVDVAARHGVYKSLLFTWRRQARDGLLSVPCADHAQFVPARLIEDAAPCIPPVDHVKKPTPQQGMIEIESRDGCRVRVAETTGLAALRRIMSAPRG